MLQIPQLFAFRSSGGPGQRASIHGQTLTLLHWGTPGQHLETETPTDQVPPLERSRRWEGLLQWMLRCSARTPQDPGPLPCPFPPFPPHSCLTLCHQPLPRKLLGPSLNILPRGPMTGLCGYKGKYLASVQDVSEGPSHPQSSR